MALFRYPNPDPLPRTREEAGNKYFAWLKVIEGQRDPVTQGPILPFHDIGPVLSEDGQQFKGYLVSGGYTTLPKGHT